MQEKKRRSAVRIMGQLIGLVKPLIHIMAAAVLLGTVGYLCAIFLTILAGQVLLLGLRSAAGGAAALPVSGFFVGMSVKTIFLCLVLLAVFRGILHYVEQYCNHFIAFKLLAIIRHRVFDALRKLCPARLEGRDKGNLISVITTDIELLEVFYAHTISPVAIAVLTLSVMILFLGYYHVYAGVLAAAVYILVGAAIPLWNGKTGGQTGLEFRNAFGDLSSFVLDSLRGLDETIQYGQGQERKEKMDLRSENLSCMQGNLSRMEGVQRSVTDLMILLSSFAMLFLMLWLYQKGEMGFEGVLICTTAMMGSFGPVTALSNLSNNLNQTLASGERVLSILEETPLVEEIPSPVQSSSKIRTDEEDEFTGVQADRATFSYEEEIILKEYSIHVEPGQVIGIHGVSGSGKSTILKLFMRFWDVNQGQIRISGEDIRKIPTEYLRNTESYVTQETHLFHNSIADNIAIGKPGASREEIMEAAKKASIHDFIMTLPEGYDTQVGELGDTLSGGEKQRIGIARAFLHDAPLMLLDEPTSNLDSLNEGIILKSLEESRGEKTIVLVSHRKSTMNLADQVYEMDQGRVS